MRTLSTTITTATFILLLQYVTTYAQDTPPLPDNGITVAEPRVPATNQSAVIRGLNLDLIKRLPDDGITVAEPRVLATNQSAIRGLKYSDLSKRQSYSCPAGTYACTGERFF